MKLKYNFYIQLMIDFLLKSNISIDEIYSVIGIQKKCKNLHECELSIENIHNLTVFTKEHIGIEHCGLEIVKNISLNACGFLGPYASSCAELKDAVFRIYETQKKMNPFITYEILPIKNPSRFIYNLDRLWEIQYPESAKEVVEFAIANGVYASQILTRKEIIPHSIGFKHGRTKDISIYKEVFKCPVYFNEDINYANYPVGIMSYKIPTYNPHLLEILDDFIAKNLSGQEDGKGLVPNIKKLLIKNIQYRSPLEAEIAEQLNISKHYLQKKLKAEGTSFNKILEAVKKELSIAYLQSAKISIKEIAWLLGYKDVSNFYRAFKRWTNKRPRDFIPNN